MRQFSSVVLLKGKIFSSYVIAKSVFKIVARGGQICGGRRRRGVRRQSANECDGVEYQTIVRMGPPPKIDSKICI